MDRSAVERAYHAHADMLYRLALSHLTHVDDAKDALQDVFVKLAVTDKHFKDDEHERAWLIRVTINRCHDLQRRRAIRLYTPLDEVTDLPDTRESDRPAVLQAVDTLPEKLKSVVVLHYLEGYSVEETAAVLKLSASAVKMRLSRARDALKNHLTKEEASGV